MNSVKNYAEILVDDLIDEILDENPGGCRCEKCLRDIKAIALNSLKPTYFSSEIGEMYKRTDILNSQLRIDAIKAITEAIEIVKKNLKH